MQLVAQALPHSLQRLVRRAIGAVPVGTIAEVLLKDGLDDETQGSLDDPISDSRDLESAGLAPILGDFHLPTREGAVGLVSQLLAEVLQQALYSLCLELFESHTVHSRRTVVFL